MRLWIVIVTFFVISLTAANCVSGRHTTARHADFDDSDYHHRHHMANPFALTESPYSSGFDFDGECTFII